MPACAGMTRLCLVFRHSPEKESSRLLFMLKGAPRCVTILAKAGIQDLGLEEV
jgi:hypothetical protein